MTSPISVGQVSIEVIASVKKLAKSLRADIEKEFKALDFSKLIQDSIGNKPIKVPVLAELDTESLKEKVRQTRVPKVKVPLDPDTKDIPEKVKKTRVPKVPVPLDPVMQAFQQEVRRQTAALSRQAIKIPVDGDFAHLRSEIAADLVEIQRQSKIQIPTEPGDKAAYEARLKAQLAEVARRVKQTVHVDVDVDKDGRAGGGIGGLTAGLQGLTRFLPSLGAVSGGVADIVGAFQKLAGTSAQAGGAMAGAAQSAAGPVGVLVGALVAAGAAAVALSTGFALAVPVLGVVAAGLTAVAGAAAAIPGALAGAGAVFGTLGLGFKGISDAFKPRAGGGGGGGGGSGEDPAARARRVAAAERGVDAARRGIAAATRGLQSAERGYDDAVRAVSDAQARAAKSQEAINRARREAKEDIDDLSRALRGAVLDEEDATLRITEALRALNQAKESGVLPDIQRADLEYRQAQLALENAKDATDDLGEASKVANKLGVEGSDKVQDALADQRDAIRAVKDAQQGVVDAQNAIKSANESLAASYDGLASAQDAVAEANKKAAAAGGGGGGLAQQVTKLAPAAEKFVAAVKALKPAFEGLRLDVQQRLFAGLDKTVTNLGKAWIPRLRETLGSYADTFNGFFKRLGTAVTTPKFISDLQTAAEGARQGLKKIGDSITSSLVPAFGALAAASAPFLKKAGEEIAKVVSEFSNWILKAEQSDKLKSFFATAAEALHDIFTTGKEVGRLIGNLFRIIFTGNGKSDKSAIDSFNDGLRKINEWLEDPSNQQKIADFFDRLKGFYEDFKAKFSTVKGILDKILPSDGEGKAGSLGVQIGSALVAGVLAGIGQTLSFQNGVLADLFLNSPLSLIGSIKRLLGIKSPSTVMAAIGRNLIEGLINGITGMFGALRTRVLGLRTTITNVFASAGSFLSNAGRNVVAGLANGIVALYGALRTRANALRAVITNALSSAGSLLYRHGQAVISGLINGISSMVRSLGSYLGQIGAFIQAHKGPIEKDRVLLFGAGQAIMGGLISGIDDKKAALAAQLADVTSLVGGTSFSDLDSGADAAITRSLQVAGANTLQATWAPGMTGDKLLDAMRDKIQFSFGGRVDRALSTA